MIGMATNLNSCMYANILAFSRASVLPETTMGQEWLNVLALVNMETEMWKQLETELDFVVN